MTVKIGNATLDGYIGITGALEVGATTTIHGNVSLQELADTPTNTSSYGKLYVKSSDNKLYFKDSIGSEFTLNDQSLAIANSRFTEQTQLNQSVLQSLDGYATTTTVNNNLATANSSFTEQRQWNQLVLQSLDGYATFHRAVNMTINGGGSNITAGGTYYVKCPFAGNITGWEIIANTSGSIVVDVWKDTFANFPPTVFDTIAGSELPTLASQTTNSNYTISSWLKTVTQGDWFAFNVVSTSGLSSAVVAVLINATS